MQIVSIVITNFKVIRHLKMEDIPNLVVLAGPNGSGKTAVFDAIRIFKEAHAGYSYINPGTSQIYNLMQQVGPAVSVGKSQSQIAATIRVSDTERQALALPDGHSGLLSGKVVINARGGVGVDDTYLEQGDDSEHLRNLFGVLYKPGGDLGVVDHIGPIRTPGTGLVEGLNFSRQSAENELLSLVLNSGGKFSSLPSDIVRMHMVDIQERDAHVPNPHHYIDRIRVIFSHFLPDAEFVGVRMDTELVSPAQILVRSGGAEHDISQLSSGQREILMAYTHLEKLALRNSVILFDEPELHLHPALERRVIGYLRRLLERSSSQIWVVTHSEEIIGTTEFDSLYKMTGRGDPAIEPVRDKASRIALLAEMGAGIGLQLISPRILFVEGKSDRDLLTIMVENWPSGVGLVEATGKGTLMRMSQYALTQLESVLRDGELFFVRDHDYDYEYDPEIFEELERRYNGQFFVWSRYHIENFLLDAGAISSVLQDFPELGVYLNEWEVEEELRVLADENRHAVLAAMVQGKFNSTMHTPIVLNPREGVKESLLKAVGAKRQQINQLLNEDRLLELLANEDARLQEQWDTNWKSLCIGRNVLQAFHNRHLTGKRARTLGYEIFRNRIASKLRETGRVPEEIRNVIMRVSAGLPVAESSFSD